MNLPDSDRYLYNEELPLMTDEEYDEYQEKLRQEVEQLDADCYRDFICEQENNAKESLIELDETYPW